MLYTSMWYSSIFLQYKSSSTRSWRRVFSVSLRRRLPLLPETPRRAETLTRARRWGGFLPISPFLTGRPWMLWRRFRLDWRGEGWSVNAANLSFLVMYIRAVLYNQRLLLFPKIPGPNCIQMRNKNHALTNKLKKIKIIKRVPNS